MVRDTTTCLTCVLLLTDPILFSAFYCTSGEQAAKRAKEGFDMVGHM